MTSLAEALGMTLPGCANIPAPDSRRLAIAEMSGRPHVEMIEADLHAFAHHDARRLSRTRSRSLMALGGSTNAVVHLIAIAGRLGIPVDAGRFRPYFAPDAVHRERQAVGRVPDGGFVPRRRRAGGDERDR